MYSATYSPEDNKLRLYSLERLPKDLYDRVRSAGFIWAPKQELFVAPSWTPYREDLLIELCGEIGDEDTSLVDRAEQRAERFEEYSDHRASDAKQASDHVKFITDGIPLGQPILIGHHSEKRARKDAERIENGMRKAVKMWETSKYWEQRAAGAISHAKYKERPDVRARRIKKIEAEKRKEERAKKEAETQIKLWSNLGTDKVLKKKNGEPATALEQALYISNYCHLTVYFTKDKYPLSEYEGASSLWSGLDKGVITPEQAAQIALSSFEKSIYYRNRWIAHFENRLIYEKAMLEEQGESDLLKPKPKPKQLPLLNYRALEGLRVENMYHRGEFSTYPQVEMTKKEYSDVYHERRGTAVIENSHRVRTLYKTAGGSLSRMVVFLTDSKTHEKPAPIEKKEVQRATPQVITSCYKEPERTEFDDMKDTLKSGIKTISAPQLFPTPPEIAERMVELAEIKPDHRILEPEAGTGHIIIAITSVADHAGEIVAVEINYNLAEGLKKRFDDGSVIVHNSDFLSCNGDLGKFDRIIMNPPFINGEDIKHIQHAKNFLKPEGKIVTLCANGPRQRETFQAEAAYWENLPEGSFKNQGTNVNVALFVIDN